LPCSGYDLFGLSWTVFSPTPSGTQACGFSLTRSCAEPRIVVNGTVISDARLLMVLSRLHTLQTYPHIFIQLVSPQGSTVPSIHNYSSNYPCPQAPLAGSCREHIIFGICFPLVMFGCEIVVLGMWPQQTTCPFEFLKLRSQVRVELPGHSGIIVHKGVFGSVSLSFPLTSSGSEEFCQPWKGSSYSNQAITCFLFSCIYGSIPTIPTLLTSVSTENSSPSWVFKDGHHTQWLLQGLENSSASGEHWKVCFFSVNVIRVAFQCLQISLWTCGFRRIRTNLGSSPVLVCPFFFFFGVWWPPP
jgi:hypothetical protein